MQSPGMSESQAPQTANELRTWNSHRMPPLRKQARRKQDYSKSQLPPSQKLK